MEVIDFTGSGGVGSDIEEDIGRGMKYNIRNTEAWLRLLMNDRQIRNLKGVNLWKEA